MFFTIPLLIGCNRNSNPVFPNYTTWTRSQGIGTAVVSNFVTGGNNIIAGASGAYLYLSRNGGANRQLLTSLPSVVTYSGSNLHPIPQVTFLAHYSILFAGVGQAYSGSISISTDDGETWFQKDTDFVQSVNCFAKIGEMIFAGTDSGVFLSSNDGKSWKAVNSGISFERTPQVIQLSVINTTLFAATTDEGIYRSTNFGKDWISVNSGLPSFAIIAITALNSNIYAARIHYPIDTTGNEIYESIDMGDNWFSPADSGIARKTVNVLYANNHGIFAGTNQGVFFTSNEGKTWADISAGTRVDSLNITGIGISGPYLLVGTGTAAYSSGEGVWLYPLSKL